MKISRTEQFRADAAPAFGSARAAKVSGAAADGTLVAFAGAEGGISGWLLLRKGEAALRGGAEDALPAHPARTVLAVPGEEVSIHWIDLPEGLAPAQAAAAARLQAAELSAQPIAEMHVAAGRRERGLTCVALAPAERMRAWLSGAAACGIDPDPVVPVPLLIPPPDEGLVRYDRCGVPAWRGQAKAFSAEPELARLVVGEAPVEEIDQDRFEAEMKEALAAPAVNLRQSAFARRRRLRVEGRTVRRLALLGLALLLVTLAIQVATLLRYTFAADRLEAEASAIGAAGEAPAPRFGAVAGLLFEAVRATPSAEVSRLDYAPDGSLAASVQGDSPATLAALRQRLEAAGAIVAASDARSAGGRPAVDLTVRTR